MVALRVRDSNTVVIEVYSFGVMTCVQRWRSAADRTHRAKIIRWSSRLDITFAEAESALKVAARHLPLA